MGGLPRALVSGAMVLWSTGSLGAAGLEGSEPEPLTAIAEDGPADLYPGFDGGDIHVRLQNPNPFPVTVESVIPGDVTSSDPDACPPSVLTVRPAGDLGLVVPPEATTEPLAIPDIVSMAPDAPDGCQGVGFTIALRVAG